jgi:hypothetical protein
MAYGVNAPFGLKPLCSIGGGPWVEKYNTYNIYTDPVLGTGSHANPIFTGDPVQWSGVVLEAGYISEYLPVRTAPNTAPGTYSTVPILGVFAGCEYVDRSTGLITPSSYWPGNVSVQAGSFIKAKIIDDPNVVWDIQTSSPRDVAANLVFPNVNATGTVYTSCFGRNFGLDIGNDADRANPTIITNPTGGNTRTGISAYYLSLAGRSATVGITTDFDHTLATLPLRAIGYTLDPRNVARPGLTMANTPYLNFMVTINNHVFGHNTPGITLA